MDFFFLVILLCSFLFLFVLYFLGKDDFVFVRKDITLKKLFNMAFVLGGVSLFFSRFFYGILQSKSIFQSPFAFLLFPYYPGLSLLGGVLGGIFALLLWGRKEAEIPKARIFDFFAVALLSVLPVGFLGHFILAGENIFSLQPLFVGGSYIAFVIAFVVFALPKLIEGKLKDGTTGFVFLVSFSLITLVSNALGKSDFLTFAKNPENVLLFVILFVSVGLLIKQESLLGKIKTLRLRRRI